MPDQRQTGLDLSGRADVVTGAVSGFNLTITRRLLAAGCTVAAGELKPGMLASEPPDRLSVTAVDVRDAAAL